MDPEGIGRQRVEQIQIEGQPSVQEGAVAKMPDSIGKAKAMSDPSLSQAYSTLKDAGYSPISAAITAGSNRLLHLVGDLFRHAAHTPTQVGDLTQTIARLAIAILTVGLLGAIISNPVVGPIVAITSVLVLWYCADSISEKAYAAAEKISQSTGGLLKDSSGMQALETQRREIKAAAEPKVPTAAESREAAAARGAVAHGLSNLFLMRR